MIDVIGTLYTSNKEKEFLFSFKVISLDCNTFFTPF